jgi:hypothetical protein
MKTKFLSILALSSFAIAGQAHAITGSNAITCSIGLVFQALQAKGAKDTLHLEATRIREMLGIDRGERFRVFAPNASNDQRLEKLMKADRAEVTLALEGWIETEQNERVAVYGTVSSVFKNHIDLYGRKVGYADCSLISAKIYNKSTDLNILNVNGPGRGLRFPRSYHND